MLRLADHKALHVRPALPSVAAACCCLLLPAAAVCPLVAICLRRRCCLLLSPRTVLHNLAACSVLCAVGCLATLSAPLVLYLSSRPAVPCSAPGDFAVPQAETMALLTVDRPLCRRARTSKPSWPWRQRAPEPTAVRAKTEETVLTHRKHFSSFHTMTHCRAPPAARHSRRWCRTDPIRALEPWPGRAATVWLCHSCRAPGPAQTRSRGRSTAPGAPAERHQPVPSHSVSHCAAQYYTCRCSRSAGATRSVLTGARRGFE